MIRKPGQKRGDGLHDGPLASMTVDLMWEEMATRPIGLLDKPNIISDKEGKNRFLVWRLERCERAVDLVVGRASGSLVAGAEVEKGLG